MQTTKKLKKHCICMLLFFIPFSTTLLSQRVITGVITNSETSDVLVGAAVSILGTSKGTNTDINGEYSITVDSEAESLSINYVGFEQAVVPIAADDEINVALRPGVSLQEVFVTATRRVSSMQEIGISITALSGVELRQNNVIKSEDLGNVTPGLSVLQPGGAPVSGLVAIRGVAQNDFAAHLESANVLFVDDVYQPSNGSILKPLFDVDRVEVLKGPQGTLFGRNATGGLIHILTKDPVNNFEGFLDLQLAEYGTYNLEGAINLPIGKYSGFRLAGMIQHNNGYITNSIGADQLEKDTRALRAKVLLKPNEDFSIKLQAEYFRNLPNATGGAFPTGGTVGEDGLGIFRDGAAHTDAGYIDADGDVFTGEFDFDGLYERTDYSLTSDITYQKGKWTFKSISAYNNLDVPYSEDNDLTPFDIAIYNQNTLQSSFTQEIRASADFKQSRLTTGLYFLNIDGDYRQAYQINNLGNFNEALGVPSSFFGLPDETILLSLGQNQYGAYSLTTNSISGFAQAEFDLTDDLTLTAGLRYTWDDKEYVYENFCEVVNDASILGACAPSDPNTLAGAGRITDEHSAGGISGRLQLDYNVNEDWLLYASYNRGYKGFNYNAGFGGAAQVEFVRFNSEQMNAFELGSKLDFLDSKARFNLSGFYNDYSDYQAFDQRGVSFILSNNDAIIYGAEGEFTIRSSKNFKARLGTILLNTTVKDIDIGGIPMERRAPQAANFEFNFGLNKDFSLKKGSIQTFVDGNYIGDYFSQLTNAPVTRVGDNWLFNLRLGYVPLSYKWEFSLFARNLLDTNRLLYSFDITFPGNGLVEQVFGNPRIIGTQIRWNF